MAVYNILKALEMKGVLNNTIIVFSSDNGGAVNGYENNWASNYPLRGGKGYYYEGGVRANAFVWGKKFEKRKGDVSYDLMHISDWLPTLYEAAGGSISHLGNISSFSMLGVLTGKTETNERTEVLINLNPANNSKALKLGSFKYMLNPHDLVSPEYDYWIQAPGSYPDTNETVLPNSAKAQIWCGEIPHNVNFSCYSKVTGLNECLYDIDNDPCEYNNLVDSPYYGQVKQKILDRIKYWEKLQVGPMLPPYDDMANPNYHNHAWVPWTNNATIPNNRV